MTVASSTLQRTYDYIVEVKRRLSSYEWGKYEPVM